MRAEHHFAFMQNICFVAPGLCNPASLPPLPNTPLLMMFYYNLLNHLSVIQTTGLVGMIISE